MKPIKLLLLGKIPPPIGGVTQHVLQLYQLLKSDEQFIVTHISLNRSHLWRILQSIRNHDLVHLHTSNTYFQLILSIACLIGQTPLVITYHGSLNRYFGLKNRVQLLSIKLAKLPIVLNQDSLEIALKYNLESKLISTYLAPPEHEPPSQKLVEQFEALRKTYRLIVCTNASKLSFDKNEKEIYGLKELINYIKEFKDVALVIATTPEYRNYLNKELNTSSEQIISNSLTSQFVSLARLSDWYIRNTTTDGDALSLYEAYLAGCHVAASACTQRPTFCQTYQQLEELQLDNFSQSKIPSTLLSNYSQLQKCYLSLTSK